MAATSGLARKRGATEYPFWDDYRDAVYDVVGGIDFLWTWGLSGSRHWRRLFAALVAASRGDDDRPIGWVAMQLPSAVGFIVRHLPHPVRYPVITVVTEDIGPEIRNQFDSPVTLRDEPTPWEGYVVLGWDWMVAHMDALVPRWEPSSRSAVRVGTYHGAEASLVASLDFSSVSVVQHDQLVASCPLKALMDDVRRYENACRAKTTRYPNPTVYNWTCEPHQSCVRYLRHHLEAFAVLLAVYRGEMLVPRSGRMVDPADQAAPYCFWVWRKTTGNPGADFGDVHGMAAVQGAWQAISYVLSEVHLRSLAGWTV